jgi:hypothetical protein
LEIKQKLVDENCNKGGDITKVINLAVEKAIELVNLDLSNCKTELNGCIREKTLMEIENKELIDKNNLQRNEISKLKQESRDYRYNISGMSCTPGKTSVYYNDDNVLREDYEIIEGIKASKTIKERNNLIDDFLSYKRGKKIEEYDYDWFYNKNEAIKKGYDPVLIGGCVLAIKIK